MAAMHHGIQHSAAAHDAHMQLATDDGAVAAAGGGAGGRHAEVVAEVLAAGGAHAPGTRPGAARHRPTHHDVEKMVRAGAEQPSAEGIIRTSGLLPGESE